MRSTVRWFAVLLLAAAASLTGCRAEEAPPEPMFANWPRVWATSGFSGPPSRASTCCRARRCRCARIWSPTGSRNSLATSGTAYPGFDRAVPPASPPSSNASTRSELVNIRPQPEAGLFGPPGRFFGNEFFHVLELTRIEGGYRAYVCDGLYNVFREGEGEETGQVRVRRRP